MLKLNKYLRHLKENAIKYERIDINGDDVTTFGGKHFKKIFSALISILIILALKKGFSQNFVSYVSSVLSILIGLFITALIFSFDKFYVVEDTENEPNAKQKVWIVQAHNYSKQFAYITGYNIVLCIFSIVVLSFSALFEDFMSINIFDFEFKFHELKFKYVLIFIENSIVIIQRFLILYWIGMVVYNTLFVVSSMVNYMMVKIDRKK